MGLGVEIEDVHRLEIHEIELSTEELQHLQEEQQRTLADDLSSDEDEVRENVPSSLILEMCAKCGKVLLFVEKYHPDTMIAIRTVHIFNDNAVMCTSGKFCCADKNSTHWTSS